jgi:hypothetical protein
VIARSGKYPPGENDLRKFVVEGEQRYWGHPPSVAAATYGEAGVAIDRFDGTIIGQQLEEVTE